MARSSSFLWLASLLLGACEQVDYLEVQPARVELRQRNNTVWLQAHPMSHTGVYYNRVRVSWSIKDPSVATVDDVGRVTPVKSGATEVVAAVGKVTAAVPVQVLFAEKMAVEPASLSLKVGQPAVEIHVKVFDYLGREIKDRTPIFHAGDQEVVSMGQNAAFPVNAGKTYLEVSVDELKQRIDVVVEAEHAGPRQDAKQAHE